VRLLFTIGRLTIFDFHLFEIDDSTEESPDVIVVHHHEGEDEGEDPGDIFGKGK